MNALTEKNEYGLRDLHQVLLEALVDIDKVCRDHGIRYTLYCGTLLGAVRHDGFIPWDDDADLAMPLSDFRRFFEIAQKELEDKYVVQTFRNNRSYPHLWMKVFRKGTTYMWRDLAGVDIDHGVAVDIYPFVGISKRYKLQYYGLMAAHALQFVDVWRATDFYSPKRYVTRLGRVISLIPRPARHLIHRSLIKHFMIDPDLCERACTLDGAPFIPKYDWKDWTELTDHRFEGYDLPIPVNYDKLLRIMYGDYMKLPPEEARMGHVDHFGDLIVDTGKDYREYQKELSLESRQKGRSKK
ncbi:MAG: LicD family protein [Firmicutes bacterium]|nr:LicD family protein [Bacillota bacterium]